MSFTSSLSCLQQSVVNEISNIGMGHAVTALSEMTGKSFNMSVPDMDLIDLHNLPTQLQGEGLAVGIYMPIDGDLEGQIGFLCSWDSACNLWTLLMGQAPASFEEVSEVEASALVELGNIINSSFLNAIVEMSGFELQSTPPLLSVDMAAAILSTILAGAQESESVALSIRNRIWHEGGEAEGVFFYLPSKSGLNKLFKRLGVEEAA